MSKYGEAYRVVVVRPFLEPRKLYLEPCSTLSEAVAMAEDRKAADELEHMDASIYFEYRIVRLTESTWLPLEKYTEALSAVSKGALP